MSAMLTLYVPRDSAALAVGADAVADALHAAALAQIRKQLSDTERELWHALRRVGYFERVAKEWRQGVRVRVIGRDCE